MNRTADYFAITLIVLVVLPSPFVPLANGATAADFTSSAGSIASAFQAIHGAAQSGGNVSSLVAQLNNAVDLFSKATEENPSNPSQATADLQNATQISQEVSAAAPVVALSGNAARQTQVVLSIVSAGLVIAVGGFLYLFGERIFRRLWLILYSGYLVRKVG